MAWFKVDDGLHSSRKLMSIPKRGRFAAIGVWTVAGSWAAGELTDGFIPEYMLTSWGIPPSAPAALVDAGLWERVDGGYLFRNWHEYQPSKQDVDAERAASRERMRELRARRKQKKPQNGAEEGGVFGRTDPNGSGDVRNPDPTRPDPTRPSISNEIDDSLSPDESDDRGTLIPVDWRPRQAHIDKAKSLHLDVKREYQRFRADAERKQRRLKRWDAGFTNWLRKAAEFNQQRQGAKPMQTFAQQRDANAIALVNSYAEQDHDEEIGNGEASHLRALDSGG